MTGAPRYPRCRGDRIVVLILAVLFSACRERGPSTYPAGEASERPPTFVASDFIERRVIRRFEFDDPGELQRWRIGDWIGVERPLADASHEKTDHWLRLSEPEARYWLIRTIDTGDRSATHLRLETEDNHEGDLLTICWAREKSPLDWECTPITLDAGGAQTIDISIPRSRKGPPASLKFQLTTATDRSVRVRACELHKSVASNEPVANRIWRVSLGGETRDACVSRAGRSTEMLIPVHQGPFQIAVGMSEDSRSGVTFELKERVGEQERVVARARMRIGSSHSVKWQELASMPGSSTLREFRLVVHPDRVDDEDPGFVFCSLAERALVASRKRPDVLLVSMDTVRADRMSLYGFPKRTTPRLDAWAARRAVIFERAIAPAPWTLPSHASLFTGLYPTRHGANVAGPLTPDYPVISEAFRAAGYETRATAVGPVLSPRFGLDRGFDRFVVRGEIGLETARWELEEGVKTALEWLREGRDRPDFIFFHTYQAHDPHSLSECAQGRSGSTSRATDSYVIPGKMTRDEFGRAVLAWRVCSAQDLAGRVLGAADRELLDAAYDCGLSRLDTAIGELFERIEDEGLGDNLVIVVLSDHGESLLERGLAGHHHLYEENLHVPLLISGPRVARHGLRVGTPVSLVDVFPTLLDIALGRAERALDGISLLPVLHGQGLPARPVWSYAGKSNRGFAKRTNLFEKYLFASSAWSAGTDRGEFFRLDRDPGEENPQTLSADSRLQLEREVAQQLRSASSSIVVSIQNSAQEAFEVVLRGADARMEAVESLDAPPGSCSFEESKIRIRVEARQSIQLLLGDRRGGQLDLEIARFSASPVFARPSHREALFLFDGRRWSRAANDSTSAVNRVRLTRSGTTIHSPGRDNDENRARLKALGYLE
ncbi:MAG: sulfatase [Acidobacteriota bacterium]